MKAGIVSAIRYPGYLNLLYGKFYNFEIDGKNVAIGLNNLTKGVKITDNENYHVDGDQKTLLHKPISEFTKGHIFRIGVQDQSGKHVNKEDWLNFSVEPDQGRDVFAMETFFTEFLIIVEFDQFNTEVFDSDDKRPRYNAAIFKAFNHFVAKYNLINNSGSLFNLISSKKSSNLSFILRQTYFKIDQGRSFYDYLSKGTVWNLSATSIVFEQMGVNGMKTASDVYIKETTTKFEFHIKNKLTGEEIFLSNALQELQKLNYKYAFLEAFLAVEASVERFLTKRKKDTDLPQKILDDFSRETGIGYQTNIEIPLAIGKIDSVYNRLIGELNTVRKTRNNIVHQGQEVTAEQVSQAISIISQYVFYLAQH